MTQGFFGGRKLAARFLLGAAGLGAFFSASFVIADSPGSCEAGGALRRTLDYRLTQDATGRWTGENQAQQLRVTFDGEGIHLAPLSVGVPPWEWSLSLGSFGEPGKEREAGFPVPWGSGDRIDFMRGPLVEWFRNTSKGLEHSLEISRPGEAGWIHLDFIPGGTLFPKVSEDGQLLEFRDAAGKTRLVYRELHGVDGEGRDVAAHWERPEAPGSPARLLRLVVEAEDHLFPIRVMGILVTPKGVSPRPARPAGVGEAAALAIPSNDQCAGAEVLPGAGPFPHFSSVVDITGATDTGDPSAPSCQAGVSHGVWFTFTPVTSASYSFSLCSGAPTATTVEDTVLAIYSASGACAGLVEVGGGCDDDSCAVTGLQSVISNIDLTAGTLYYVVAWEVGSAPPPPGAESLQLQVVQHAPPGPSPANDHCDGSEIIPGAGPFPYLTSVTQDISGADTTGDPAAPSCQLNVSRSLWYSFTPPAAGRYTFSACADAPTGSTVDDTVLTLYTETGACSGVSEVPGGCDDDSCIGEAGQSVIYGASLEAGTRYRLVVRQYGTTPPLAGNTAVQVRVGQVVGPPNDGCASATSLSLDAPLSGTTVASANDTQLPAGSACFTGIGQTASTGPGGDVAYRFTAPGAGKYSFRVGGYDTTKNAVLYVASDCPAGGAPATVAACIGAANRNASYPAEEVKCLPLSAGQSVYVYVDEHASTSGSAFTVEASRCREEEEPNGTPAAAAGAVCGVEGAITLAGEADFFALGTPAAGSRVFAMADGAAGNSSDFDLRITTEADTLEYDDLNNDLPFGTVSPNVSGTPLTGAASFLRVSHYSAAAQAEPYRLYHAIQPPAAGASTEAEPNNTSATATAGANDYFHGVLSGTADLDFFSFTASAGEMLLIGLDLDPARDNTPFNGSLSLVDGLGAALVTVNDAGSSSSSLTGSGSLVAVMPFSPAEAIAYRVRSAGTYFVKVAWSSGTPGDYLLSISHDCRIRPATDLAVTQADSPDPVLPGGAVTYSLTVSNQGAHPASVVVLRDDLPAGAVLVSSLPTQGSCLGSAPVVCQMGNLGAGASAAVSLVVTAPQAPGPITNTAAVSMAVMDASPANDVSSEITTVGSPDTDGDGVVDAVDCAPQNAAAWAVPGEATGLIFPSAANTSQIQWSAPAAPGGTVVTFDLLRSTAAADFLSAACVATNLTLTSASDPAVPGSIFFYLVRSENACGGNLGTRSNGTPRSGVSCP